MRITIRDIARIAGVSVSTVSHIINNKEKSYSKETKEHVLKVIKEYNYIPNQNARALSTHKSKAVACVIKALDAPYWIEILQGVESICSENNYTLHLCIANYDDEKVKKYLRILESRGVDGVILAYDMSVVEDEVKALIERGITVVAGVDSPIIKGAYIVGINSFILMLQTRRKLTEEGYLKVGYIGNYEKGYNEKKLYEGYYQASIEAGVEEKEMLTCAGNYTEETGYKAVKLLQEKGCDAIIVSNTAMLPGVYNYYQEYAIPVEKRPKIITLVSKTRIQEEAGGSLKNVEFKISGCDVGRLAMHTFLKVQNNEGVATVQLIMPNI